MGATSTIGITPTRRVTGAWLAAGAGLLAAPPQASSKRPPSRNRAARFISLKIVPQPGPSGQIWERGRGGARPARAGYSPPLRSGPRQLEKAERVQRHLRDLDSEGVPDRGGQERAHRDGPRL